LPADEDTPGRKLQSTRYEGLQPVEERKLTRTKPFLSRHHAPLLRDIVPVRLCKAEGNNYAALGTPGSRDCGSVLEGEAFDFFTVRIGIKPGADEELPILRAKPDGGAASGAIFQGDSLEWCEESVEGVATGHPSLIDRNAFGE